MDSIFLQLSRDGYVLGDKLRECLTDSLPLSPSELAQIWELSDVDRDGRLCLTEFHAFMRYTNDKLRLSESFMDEEFVALLSEWQLAREEQRRCKAQLEILNKQQL